jgi:tRNA nucleotidyltransferase (CCA-adding enzyme)
MKFTDATNTILTVLRTAGTPIIVGGAVRDWIMGPSNTPADIDIEVFGATHDDIVQSLDSFGIQFDAVGKSFGVFKATLKGEEFDIALPRTESKIGPMHRDFSVWHDPDITFEQAFRRRDFTINAIGFDPDSCEIIDPFNGEADIECGLLRHTSEAFSEDPLRVLRGAQFAARFGLTTTLETNDVFIDLAPEFATISLERVWGELSKLFGKGDLPSWGIDVLDESHWAVELDCEFALDGVGADMCAAQCIREGVDERRRLLMVLATATSNITSAGRTRFFDSAGVPNSIRKDLQILITEAQRMKNDCAVPSVVMHMLRRLDRTGISFDDVASVAAHSSFGHAEDWASTALKIGGSFKLPLVTGTMLLDIGMKPGPDMGRIISKALWLQDEGLLNTPDEARGFCIGSKNIGATS